MALNLKKSEAARDAEMEALVTLIGSGGVLKIYDGAQPTNPDTALGSQNVLAELALASPCGSVSGGVLTFDTIDPDSSADMTGTAAWFSIEDSEGNRIIEGTVGTSGANMTIDNTSIEATGEVGCSSFTITAGNA